MLFKTHLSIPPPELLSFFELLEEIWPSLGEKGKILGVPQWAPVLCDRE